MHAMHRSAGIVFLTGAIILGGCGYSTEGAPDGGSSQAGDANLGSDSDAGAAESDFSVTPETPRVNARVTAVATLDVSVERSGGFDDPIVISATNLPAGVSANEITLDSGSDSGVIEIDARGGAAGELADVTLVATSGELTRTADIELLLVGEPGALDDSFGDEGLKDIPLSAGPLAEALVLESGEMFAAGAVDGAAELFVANIQNDAELDQDFGDEGIATIDIAPHHTEDEANAPLLARQSDGHILVATRIDVSGSEEGIALARLTPEGELDTSFAGGGVVSYGGGSSTFEPRAIDVADDDSFAVAGSTGDGDGGQDVLVLRFSGEGLFDQDFGDSGRATFDTGSDSDRARSIAFVGGEKLVVGVQAGFDEDGRALRVLADGTIDGDFGDAGVVELSGFQARPLAAGPSGDGLLLAGFFLSNPLDEDPRASFWRVEGDGSSDSRLGADLPDYASTSLRQLVIVDDSRAVGVGGASGGPDGASAWLLAGAAGDALDEEFGDDGISLIPREEAGTPLGAGVREPHWLVAAVPTPSGLGLLRIWL